MSSLFGFISNMVGDAVTAARNSDALPTSGMVSSYISNNQEAYRLLEECLLCGKVEVANTIIANAYDAVISVLKDNEKYIAEQAGVEPVIDTEGSKFWEVCEIVKETVSCTHLVMSNVMKQFNISDANEVDCTEEMRTYAIFNAFEYLMPSTNDVELSSYEQPYNRSVGASR